LIVDPYAVLPFALSFQSFKAIAWQSSQIQPGGCGFKTVELQPRSTFNTGERFNSLSPREVSRALVPVTEDHKSKHKPLLRVTSSIIKPATRPLSGDDDVGSILKHKFNAVEPELAQ